MECGWVFRLPQESAPYETLWERVEHMVNKVPIFRQDALEHLCRQQVKDKQRYKVKHYQFKLGQQVLVSRDWIGAIGKNFKPKWDGPFEIVKCYGHGTYVLEDHQGVQTKSINRDKLKLFKDRLYLKLIIVIEN